MAYIQDGGGGFAPAGDSIQGPRETGAERIGREPPMTSVAASVPSGTTALATAAAQPVSPWDRLADVLGKIQAPSVPVPQAEPQTVSYVEGQGPPNMLGILLILAAAGGGYWWYTQRKKGS